MAELSWLDFCGGGIGTEGVGGTFEPLGGCCEAGTIGARGGPALPSGTAAGDIGGTGSAFGGP